jgi:hypothetical protein
MDQPDATSRAVLLGHLAITVAAITAILLVLFFGSHMYGPFLWPSLWPYHISAGLTIAWQWYSAAQPRWRESLKRRGVAEEEIERIARSNGLVWPGISFVGLFVLHTTAAAICGIHFGPWLLSRWFAWIVPLTGITSHAPTGNDWLQHFELASIIPALLVGYVLSRHFRGMAACAWILPTVILAYKLLTFTEPQASVLAAHSSTRFSYFFVIQRSVPTFSVGFGGVDPVRVSEQIDVVAPLYAGVAYSIGALAARHNLLEKFFGHSRGMQPEPELAPETPEEAEKPA